MEVVTGTGGTVNQKVEDIRRQRNDIISSDKRPLIIIIIIIITRIHFLSHFWWVWSQHHPVAGAPYHFKGGRARGDKGKVHSGDYVTNYDIIAVRLVAAATVHNYHLHFLLLP